MGIKAIIYDKNKRYIKTIEGTYTDGKYIYKVGEPIAIWLGFGKKLSIPMDYSKLIDKGNTKEGWYSYDGKNYNQLSLEGKTDSPASVKDYIQDFKIGEYAKQSVLKKPFDIKDVFQLIMFILMIAILISFYVVGRSTSSSINNAYKPINKTLNATVASLEYEHNQTVYITKLDNKTLAALTTCLNNGG